MEPMCAQVTNLQHVSEKNVQFSRENCFFTSAFYQLVPKLKKPVEQLVTLLGMWRQLLVMGLVTQLKLLVRE